MEAPSLERKLVAILAADVEGYSRMMEIDEEGTLATLSAHRTITDELIAQHGGRIFNTAGDSVLAEFASVFSAIDCAVDIQRELAIANQPIEETRRLRFRIGINVGDVMVKDGDIFGDGVNIAARLEGLAKPGGICISRGVRDHIRHKLPHRFEDLGEQAVKNIAQPVRCFRLLPRKGKPEPPQAPGPIALQPDPVRATPAPDPRAVELVFWDSIKDSLRAADYEAYLGQYPAGNFAALARARLAELIESTSAPRDPAEREIELAFWDSVRELDNVESLQAYLDKYPTGEFVALAEIRLKELAETDAPARVTS
jgi:class 3 adenylate cyclase